MRHPGATSRDLMRPYAVVFVSSGAPRLLRTCVAGPHLPATVLRCPWCATARSDIPRCRLCLALLFSLPLLCLVLLYFALLCLALPYAALFCTALHCLAPLPPSRRVAKKKKGQKTGQEECIPLLAPMPFLPLSVAVP